MSGHRLHIEQITLILAMSLHPKIVPNPSRPQAHRRA